MVIMVAGKSELPSSLPLVFQNTKARMGTALVAMPDRCAFALNYVNHSIPKYQKKCFLFSNISIFVDVAPDKKHLTIHE